MIRRRIQAAILRMTVNMVTTVGRMTSWRRMEEAGPELRTESLLGTRGEGLALIENKVREVPVARRNMFRIKGGRNLESSTLKAVFLHESFG